ncbi:type IX secretion system membrane protein PorP/SprF [Flavobacterium sediminilitoris]|uniref:Type IX secretion system membrane protein PorP/SprF n=1 Tax=Flavobacterium sediminilitoris TaxID=2024526 RepID=A0ABY4HJD7_9FLAO|nr:MULTISPECIES: type IX secretion system membrane protein PorP/SprF [Flavobacterium]UOX32678.1 type IX secretion system membrane protein PorP/SprF [Flavobacterium sediminilitoris]
MKLYKIFFSILFLFITSSNAVAQVEPNYSLYRYTTNFFNPAAFGVDEKVTIKTNFRSQFLGIDNAPETQSISLGVPIKDKMNLGAIVIADKVFIERTTSLFATFSYKIQVGEATDLLFGIQAGGTFVNIDFERLGLPVDPFLSQNANYFNPNIGAGFYLKNEKYFASLSVPRLFETDRVADKNGIVTQANNKAQLYVSGGYHFNISNDIKFIPSTLVRLSEEEIITDATGTFEFFKKFDVGVNYRLDRAIGGLLYITVKNRLKLGYAYESNLSDINKYDNGTHEFGLSFEF